MVGLGLGEFMLGYEVRVGNMMVVYRLDRFAGWILSIRMYVCQG